MHRNTQVAWTTSERRTRCTPTTHGTRLLAKVVGIVGVYLHFAWRVGMVDMLRRSANRANYANKKFAAIRVIRGSRIGAMQIYLAGHLPWYDSRKHAHIEIAVPQPTWLIDLLRDLGIPIAEIAIAVVNGRAVDLQIARVSDSDRVELFPPVGGGK